MTAGLARWLLDRDPDIRTAGVGGFVVPAALFVEVPAEFLEGARIDGHMFRPALAGFEPHGLGYRPVGVQPAEVVPVDDGPKPEAAPSAVRKTTVRRTPRGGAGK